MIAIIDSGGANIASIKFALERLNIKAMLTRNIDTIKAADRVILPGVGSAPGAMRKLSDYSLIDCIQSLTQPVLGICLGMQLLFKHTQEGDVEMLDIIPGKIEKFATEIGKTIPHTGWNTVHGYDHKLLRDIPQDSFFYFVHSYFAPIGDFNIGTCNYGESFSAIVVKDNFIGCQFHPERSGEMGSLLLKNFAEIKP